MWRLRRCPRCNGDLFTSKDADGWYEQCIQCGYTNKLKIIARSVLQEGEEKQPVMALSSASGEYKKAGSGHNKHPEDETLMKLGSDGLIPHNDVNLENILSELQVYKPQKERAKPVKKARLIERGLANILDPTAERLQQRVRDYRTGALRLLEPVRLHKLKETLLELGGTEQFNGVPLPYPKREYLLETFEGTQKVVVGGFLEIDYVYIPPNKAHKLTLLHQYVSTLTHVLGCHPAVALSFVMCDIVPKSYSSIIVIRDGHKLNIHVPYPGISPQLVSKAYATGSNMIVKKRWMSQGGWAKPRHYSDKMIQLLRFRLDNPRTKWKDLFTQWNEQFNKENQNWQFKNLRSMQITYYYALKRSNEVI